MAIKIINLVPVTVHIIAPSHGPVRRVDRVERGLLVPEVDHAIHHSGYGFDTPPGYGVVPERAAVCGA